MKREEKDSVSNSDSGARSEIKSATDNRRETSHGWPVTARRYRPDISGFISLDYSDF